MLPNSLAVKSTALAALKGRWAEAIATVFIPLAALLLLLNLLAVIVHLLIGTPWVFVAYFAALIAIIFIIFPLALGSLRIIWGITCEKEMPIANTFYYFSSKIRYMSAANFLGVLCGSIIAKTLLLFFPAIISYLCSELLPHVVSNNDARLWLDNMWVFTQFLSIIAAFGTLYICLRYYLAPFLFICGENGDAVQTVLLAHRVSRVSLGSFVTLCVSLIGWLFISVFYVPLILTAPYLMCCYLFHCRFVAVYYNLSFKKAKEGALL